MSADASSDSLGGGHVRRALHLRTFPAFSRLPPEALAVLAEPCVFRTFEPGEALLVPGRPVEALHFILSGAVEVFEGGARVRTMGAREAVGGLGLFDPRPEGVDARALRRTETLALSRKDLEAVFEDHPEIRAAITRAVARTLRNVLARDRVPHVGLTSPGRREASARPFEAQDVVEWMRVLVQAFAFCNVTVAAAADLARDAREARSGPGEHLWRVGERATELLVLAHGEVEACVPGGVALRIGPGEVTGLLEALAEEPRWYDLVGVTPIRALALRPDVLLDVADEHRDLASGLLRALAHEVALRFKTG